MRVGELRQICRLPEDGQSIELARTIADFTESKVVQFAHLAEALHDLQPPQADDGVNPIANPKVD